MMRSISLCSLLVLALLQWSARSNELDADARPQRAPRTSPVGSWKTVDDTTGKVRSIVAIWEENGKLYGKIEELIDPDPRYPNPRCVRCPGVLKDAPVIGLRILWELTGDGDRWSGGKVLDPDNGKVYRCQVALTDAGNKLKVRGFIGISFLGRTQVWLRAD